jgi:predicted TIM-barrel fold metal-dependent hydrolase
MPPVPAPGPVLDAGRYSYCDPSEAIATYPRFDITPEIVTRLYPAGDARDYPVVDAHTHLTFTAEQEVELQRRAGIHASVVASLDAVSTARLRETYPAPNLIQFHLADYLHGFDEGKLPGILARFEEQRAAGAGGIKIWKTLGLENDDATGERLRIDDRRLYPIWRRAAEERWTISIHVADVASWMTGEYADSPYSKQDLVHQFIRVVEDHPTTVFVAIHLLNLIDSEAELDQLGGYLARYPNLYADVSARSQDLAYRDAQHVRRFMIAHQDKLLFATDRNTQDEAGYEEEFKYWETSQVSRTFRQNRSVRGLALPRDVLEKFYYRNALRAFCGELR